MHKGRLPERPIRLNIAGRLDNNGSVIMPLNSPGGSTMQCGRHEFVVPGVTL